MVKVKCLECGCEFEFKVLNDDSFDYNDFFICCVGCGASGVHSLDWKVKS